MAMSELSSSLTLQGRFTSLLVTFDNDRGDDGVVVVVVVVVVAKKVK